MGLFATLYNLSSTADIITTVGEASSPIFSELIPIGLVIVGFSVGIGLVGWLVSTIIGAVRGNK